jgi:anti-sigma factor RsiW
MNHPSDTISAYLDGELTTEEVKGLLTHLSSCGKCASELAELQEVRGRIRSLPLLEVPDGLVPLTTSNVVPLRRNRGLLVGAAAAVVAAVIAIAALVTPTPQPVTVSDLNSRFGARVSLDPAFGPAKVIVPNMVEIAE